MKKVLFLLFWFALCGVVRAIQPGIADIAAYKSLWEGKRVALVANQTSVVDGRHSVDFLREQGVDVVRIFCPEHGFRGNADAGEAVDNGKDEATGLPVISLYGKRKKPSPDDLKGVDLVIFDMQDVGVRFYT